MKTVVSLRTVAERVGLAPCSISAVLNNTPASRAIPQRTKDRIFRAAAELNYRPNLWARSLRTQRTRLVAVITPDIGQAAVARVVAGVQHELQRRGYLLALGTFDCHSDWHNISVQLSQRGIEGVIAIDAALPSELELPVASVDLQYLTLHEPLEECARTWLSELGKSKVEALLRQIEKGTVRRRMEITPNLPNAYVAARLGVDADARERA
ncbi:MAG: LacI family DNA-binding transcriptional regulator [Candidatus Sulfotelmatobacter sp.]